MTRAGYNMTDIKSRIHTCQSVTGLIKIIEELELNDEDEMVELIGLCSDRFKVLYHRYQSYTQEGIDNG